MEFGCFSSKCPFITFYERSHGCDNTIIKLNLKKEALEFSLIIHNVEPIIRKKNYIEQSLSETSL